MWEAVRSNLYFFLFAFVISVIFIVYMVAAHGSSSAVEFVGLMMAMGNTYGVLLIICLLGTFDGWCGVVWCGASYSVIVLQCYS